MEELKGAFQEGIDTFQPELLGKMMQNCRIHLNEYGSKAGIYITDCNPRAVIYNFAKYYSGCKKDCNTASTNLGLLALLDGP